jgi:hypothetical protein
VGKPSTALVGFVAVIICFTLGCVTALVALGRDPEQVLYLAVLIGAPTITSVLGLLGVDKIKGKVETIEKNTNGNLTALLDQNKRLLGHLETRGVITPAEAAEERASVAGPDDTTPDGVTSYVDQG